MQCVADWHEREYRAAALGLPDTVVTACLLSGAVCAWNARPRCEPGHPWLCCTTQVQAEQMQLALTPLTQRCGLAASQYESDFCCQQWYCSGFFLQVLWCSVSPQEWIMCSRCVQSKSVDWLINYQKFHKDLSPSFTHFWREANKREIWPKMISRNWILCMLRLPVV